MALTLKPDPIPEIMRAETVRYGGENRKTLEMSKDNDCVKLLQSVRKQVKSDARKFFMLSAVRVTKNMSPQIWEVIDTVIATLRLKVEPEIYVRQSADLNAGCATGAVSLQEAQPVLILTSGLIEKMTSDELLFVLGHELGHWIFKHHEFSVPNILQFQEANEYPFQAMQIMSWSRASEVSCDRTGLLCCQNFNTAIRTFFKLASGLSDDYIEPDLKDYWQQVIEAGSIPTSPGDDLGWFSSHPFNPFRLKALYHFWCWDQLASLWKGPKPAQQLKWEQIDPSTDAILREMDPDYLRSEQVAVYKITEFMAWAGMIVMAADGKVDPREIQRIKGFVGDKLCTEVTTALNNGMTPKEAWNKCGDLSVPLRGKSTKQARTQMVANLLTIASSDGQLHNNELNAIANLCSMMDLDPSIMQTLIENMAPRRPRRRRGWF